MVYKKWLYYLIDEEGRSFYIENGIVKSSAVPKPLSKTPSGWQDILIAWERDIEKRGILQEFSFPLGFVKDGAKIIRSVAYNGIAFKKDGIETKLYLLIQKLHTYTTATTYRHIYKYFYKGLLDFSSFDDQNEYVKIKVSESKLHRNVKANLGTKVEIPIDTDDYISVKMDGLSFAHTAKFFVVDNITYSNTQYSFFTPPVPHLGTDGQPLDIAFTNQNFEKVPNPLTYPSESNNCFASVSAYAEHPLTLTLKGQIVYQVVFNNINSLFNVRFLTNKGQTIQIHSGGALVTDEIRTIPIDLNITLQPGEKLFLVFQLFSIVTGAIELSIKNLEGSELNITVENKFKTTSVKALTPDILYKRLVGKATDDENYALSTLLDNNKNIVITCGDAIRGLPGATIKTSLADFFTHCKVTYNAGMAIENDKLLIEETDHFYNVADPIPLGEVKKLKLRPAVDYLASIAKFGYEEQEYDDVNGKFEYNNTSSYTSPLTIVQKELELVNPYRADSYGIELTRQNLANKTTTDSSSDNDIFILSIQDDSTVIEGSTSFSSLLKVVYLFGQISKKDIFQPGVKFAVTGSVANNFTFTVVKAVAAVDDNLAIQVAEEVTDEGPVGVTLNIPGYKLRRDNYDLVEGIPYPDTAFNIEPLTPARLAQIHQKWTNSIYNSLAGKKLKFQTTPKNSLLKTVKGAVTIKENADLPIHDTPKYFLPWYFEFETKVPINLAEILEVNPNRCFSFIWSGKTYTGFLMKAGIAPNTNKSQVYRLLSSPENDLTTLIK